MTGTKLSNAHSLALSGVLSTFGQVEEVFIPKFIVESVVANSLAIICLQHLFDSKNGQKSQKETFKVSVIELLKYYGAFFISAK